MKNPLCVDEISTFVIVLMAAKPLSNGCKAITRRTVYPAVVGWGSVQCVGGAGPTHKTSKHVQNSLMHKLLNFIQIMCAMCVWLFETVMIIHADLFINWSVCVQILCMICSEYVQNIFIICSDFVQNMFRICSEFVHNLFRICS